jgi:circadian clock protein KaiB
LKTNKPKQKIAAGDKYALRLYIAGQTSDALRAIKNLNTLCKNQLKGKYHSEIIDILKNPKLCRAEQIIAIPTLMRKSPLPVRQIIGDLSNTERVLAVLGLKEYN